MSSHIVDGEFQSDKYPTTPRGKVPLSVKDPTAQDLLWQYAQRRRVVDSEFSDDLEVALRTAGYVPNANALNADARRAITTILAHYDRSGAFIQAAALRTLLSIVDGSSSTRANQPAVVDADAAMMLLDGLTGRKSATVFEAARNAEALIAAIPGREIVQEPSRRGEALHVDPTPTHLEIVGAFMAGADYMHDHSETDDDGRITLERGADVEHAAEWYAATAVSQPVVDYLAGILTILADETTTGEGIRRALRELAGLE